MRRLGMPLLQLSLLVLAGTAALAGEFKKPITKPKYDPSAPRVGLFDGLDAKSLDAELRPKNEFGGNLFIRNLTDKPITVELPDAIVGVQVHPQFFLGAQGGNGFGQQQGQGNGNGGGMGMGMAGANQSVGGGAGNGQGQGQNSAGLGLFSIPAGEVVRLPFASVCLEHGKPTPTARNQYRLVRPESYSDKPELAAICRAAADSESDRLTVQAAAWHTVSGLSWEDLAKKTYDQAAAADTPYFKPAQLKAARDLVAKASRPAPAAPKSVASESVVSTAR